MVETLRIRLDAVERRANVVSEITVIGNANWPKAWENELYPLAMEALNNSLKHAFASRVQVSLEEINQHLVMVISDNGRGFDHQNIGEGGLGLRNMMERADRLGGKLEITSNPGEGTRICASIPMHSVPFQQLIINTQD